MISLTTQSDQVTPGVSALFCMGPEFGRGFKAALLG